MPPPERLAHLGIPDDVNLQLIEQTGAGTMLRTGAAVAVALVDDMVLVTTPIAAGIDLAITLLGLGIATSMTAVDIAIFEMKEATVQLVGVAVDQLLEDKTTTDVVTIAAVTEAETEIEMIIVLVAADILVHPPVDAHVPAVAGATTALARGQWNRVGFLVLDQDAGRGLVIGHDPDGLPRPL